ncbi:hypothetical protein Vretifemale_11675 [Volvox reticuliferus]|uniref:Uncharacterized protein n=1 Tax=Volvox reticuliferus TaxID=1737510 RepID=A0A8J4CQA1_9CHLO|nr:hypothetical protein Vretifemale_11675 [Volvox reticuliferus]
MSSTAEVCLIRSEDWPQGLPTCREAQNSTSGSSFSPSVLSLVVPKMTTSGSGRSGAGGEPGEAASVSRVGCSRGSCCRCGMTDAACLGSLILPCPCFPTPRTWHDSDAAFR